MNINIMTVEQWVQVMDTMDLTLIDEDVDRAVELWDEINAEIREIIGYSDTQIEELVTLCDIVELQKKEILGEIEEFEKIILKIKQDSINTEGINESAMGIVVGVEMKLGYQINIKETTLAKFFNYIKFLLKNGEKNTKRGLN